MDNQSGGGVESKTHMETSVRHVQALETGLQELCPARLSRHPFCSDEYFNEKYGCFYLVRYSTKTYRFVQAGKPWPTIQAARLAAERADARNPKWMTFIDTKRPT